MLQYRKELDGLRALAVIAVLFYHVNLVSYPLFEHTFLPDKICSGVVFSGSMFFSFCRVS